MLSKKLTWFFIYIYIYIYLYIYISKKHGRLLLSRYLIAFSRSKKKKETKKVFRNCNNRVYMHSMHTQNCLHKQAFLWYKFRQMMNAWCWGLGGGELLGTRLSAVVHLELHLWHTLKCFIGY